MPRIIVAPTEQDASSYEQPAASPVPEAVAKPTAQDTPPTKPKRTAKSKKSKRKSPQPSPQPKCTVSEILQRRVEESAALLDAAERVLVGIARGQSPSSEERNLLTTLGFVGPRLDAEVLRIRRVVAWQDMTGTHSDRKAARESAKIAAEKLARRGPEIDEAMQQLSAERADLERTAGETESVVQRHAEAVKSLRKRELLPEQVQGELDDLARQIQPLRAKLKTAEGEVERTALLAGLAVDHPTVVGHAEARQLQCFSMHKLSHDSAEGRVDPAGWKTYIAQRQAEDEQRRAEIDRLEASIEPLIQKREKLLSFYVK